MFFLYKIINVKFVLNENLYSFCLLFLPFCSLLLLSVGVVPEKKLKLLLLGLVGSGKTEIAHYLSKTKRLDYDSTNGVHNYSMMVMETLCSLTEIGGNEDIQNIWHHYYAGVS